MTAIESKTSATAEVIQLADSEKALVALVKQYDQQAFRRLYDMYVNRVYALCLRLTGNKSSAEEACQETFLKVWKKIGSFNGSSKFSTWLHTVATNTTLSYMRKHKGWKARFFSIEANEDIADPVAEPHTDIGKLDALLPKLPERPRVVFVMHAMEGFRHEDIGKALKITAGASKAHFHRARTLITQWLDESS